MWLLFHIVLVLSPPPSVVCLPFFVPFHSSFILTLFFCLFNILCDLVLRIPSTRYRGYRI